MKELIIGVALSVTIASIAVAADKDWNLLSQSKEGRVSINGGLTAKDCEFWKHRLLGEPATPAEQKAEAAYQVDQQKFTERVWAAGNAACAAGKPETFQYGQAQCDGNRMHAYSTIGNLSLGDPFPGESSFVRVECFQ